MKKYILFFGLIILTIDLPAQSTFLKGIIVGRNSHGFRIKVDSIVSTTGSNILFYHGATSLTGTGSMSYPGAGIALSTGVAWGVSITNNSTNWNTAYSDRLKWDGGATGLVAATGRTSLGATTIGSAFFMLTNPSAITFPRINADNSITALSTTALKTALSINDTIPLETIVKLQSDTIPFATFGYGGRNATDTNSCVVNTDIGSFRTGPSDSLFMVEIRGGVSAGEGTPTVGVQFYYDANLWDATPTSILNSTTNITSTTGGTSITSFAVTYIPPDMWVWGEIETVSAGNKPTALRLQWFTYERNLSY